MNTFKAKIGDTILVEDKTFTVRGDLGSDDIDFYEATLPTEPGLYSTTGGKPTQFPGTTKLALRTSAGAWYWLDATSSQPLQPISDPGGVLRPFLGKLVKAIG